MVQQTLEYEKTLEYENAHFLLSLLAGNIDLAQEIGKNFNVRVTTRDAWIKFFGNKANVDQAVKVMRDLERARRDGSDISEKAFSFAIDSEKIGHDCKVSDLLGYRILGSKGRPAVTPRNRTQLKYLKTMDENEVVFGPSLDGGYYFLGLSKLIPELFDNVEWSTERVLEQSLSNIALRSLKVYLGEVLSDVDEVTDVARYPSLKKIIS